MDKGAWIERLQSGASALRLDIATDACARMFLLQEMLLKWNQRINLTAVKDPNEILERHLLDSLTVLQEIEGAATLLDVGTGAGFPGLPLRIVRADLEVTLVDTVAKKIGFVKAAIGQLGLAPGARALHARAEGRPEREGLPRVDRVVSRALTEPATWVPLAKAYVREGGRVVAMMGKTEAEGTLRELAERNAMTLVSLRVLELPFSRAPRAIAVFAAHAR